MRVTRWTPLIMLPLAACINLFGSGTRTVGQQPSTVVPKAADVFRQFSIPVERADEIFGEVESGRFAVWEGWGGEPLENRVACSGIEDLRLAGPDSVMLEVVLEADRRPKGGLRGGMQTEVRLRGLGTAYFADGRTGCRLTRDFADRVLTAVTGPAGFDQIVELEG